MSARAVSQSGDEAVYFGLHLLAQPGQALLRVVQELLDEGSDEETVTDFSRIKSCFISGFI